MPPSGRSHKTLREDRRVSAKSLPACPYLPSRRRRRFLGLLFSGLFVNWMQPQPIPECGMWVIVPCGISSIVGGLAGILLGLILVSRRIASQRQQAATDPPPVARPPSRG